MIGARLAAPRRAALITTLVLAAALFRALLLPLGDAPSTATFAACLLAITMLDRPAAAERGQWGRGRAVFGGLVVGALLIAPAVTGRLATRPLAAFWPWATIAALVATLEETSIRGVLYRYWRDEAGTWGAVLAGAIVFALIHLPRYGMGAMPLDLAVGLALGGLRALTGRVMPCAVAHTIADWGAWFWS